MASVGSLILSATYNTRFAARPNSPLSRLNAWMTEHKQGRFVPVGQDYAAGPKGFEAELFIASTNYLPLEDMLAFFRSLEWGGPADVQLFVRQSHEDRFTVYSAEAPT